MEQVSSSLIYTRLHSSTRSSGRFGMARQHCARCVFYQDLPADFMNQIRPSTWQLGLSTKSDLPRQLGL